MRIEQKIGKCYLFYTRIVRQTSVNSKKAFWFSEHTGLKVLGHGKLAR